MNIKGHFETITRHKLLVMKYCFACGLYEQGLAHDLSKYSPTEFIPGCIYYQGDHSPNEAEREAKGYTSAWLHHKGRNKHHLEYWIDYSTTKAGLTGMKIPLRYVCEMVCDRIAASQIYLGDRYTDASPWEYYERSRDHYLLHPETRALLEKLLQMVRDLGQERTFAYMKFLLRKRLLSKNRNASGCCVSGGIFQGRYTPQSQTSPSPDGTPLRLGDAVFQKQRRSVFAVVDLDIVGAAFVHKEQHAGQRDSQTGQNSEQYFQKFHGQTLLNGMRPGHGVRPELC